MPPVKTSGYDNNEQLPSDVKKQLPEEAQDVYRLAYNSALAGRKPEPAQEAWKAVELGWEVSQGLWQPRH